MGAETFPHVSPGDPLRIPAETWNALMDLGRSQRAGNPVPSGVTAGGELPPGVIWIRNDSGEDRGQFEILGIDDILIAPDNNLSEFLYNPGLVGVMPDARRHTGAWAVTLEPIADGALGRARIFGIAPVLLDVSHESDTRAEILEGDGSKLGSNATGSAQIVWKEPGTGEKRALIRFPLETCRKARKILVTSDQAFASTDGEFAAHVVDWDDPDIDPDPDDSGLTINNPHKFAGTADSMWEAHYWPIHDEYRAIQGYCDPDHDPGA